MKPMIYKEKSTREVLAEGTFLNYRYWILSYGTHPCAYVEIPKNNPYRKIKDELKMNIKVHGGLTYLDESLLIKDNGEEAIKNSYIIGWDYAHCLDYMPPYFLDGKKYTTEEIYEDVKSVINQLISKEVINKREITMQDRFKFRVWNKGKRQYNNGMLIFDYMRGILDPDKYILEQCTALKDKNGKLIYEGDWLKTKDGFYCYVVWFYGFYWVKSLPSEAIDLEHAEFYRECEVVGNIHDNPNFMEKEDEQQR